MAGRFIWVKELLGSIPSFPSAICGLYYKGDTRDSYQK